MFERDNENKCITLKNNGKVCHITVFFIRSLSFVQSLEIQNPALFSYDTKCGNPPSCQINCK